MVRKILAAALLLAAALVPLTLAPSAYADSASNPAPLTATADLGTDSAGHDLPDVPENGDLFTDGSVQTTVDWTQLGVLGVDWDPNLVRQGRSLDPAVAWTPIGIGTMTVHYTVSGTACVYVEGLCIGFSLTATFNASGPCELKVAGGDYACHLQSNEIELFEPCPDLFNTGETSTCPLSPRVVAYLASDVTVSPDALDTLRTATLAGDLLGTNPLVLDPSDTDDLDISCQAGVGDTLGYQLGDLSATPGLSVDTSLVFSIQISAPVPAPVTFPYIDIASPAVDLGNDLGNASVSGPGMTTSLSEVQANNIPPVLTVADSFSGDEGTPIQFIASATGPCAEGATFVWHFSDGTTAYGAHPLKAFEDSGPFTGSVTVTDTTGLTDTEDFTVDVANLDPLVQVLPNDPTIAWGRDLTMEAQALDPGADDQGDLTYAWTFGDSSPVMIGGPVETHAWSLPGVYDASVEVCDDDTGCTTDAFTVTVRKRTTSIAYTGSNSADHSGPATLSGSLVDEYGGAVNGASMTFTLGGAPEGSALTGPTGVASRTIQVSLPAGSYDVTAAFAGNALYDASGPATESFDVSEMGSVITWTGTTSGKPNKDVPLSAKLVDELGRALAGRTVTFTIGTQSINGTTNASGVATAVIKLSQKPGTYAYEVSWLGDPGRYLGDSANGSFKINTK